MCTAHAGHTHGIANLASGETGLGGSLAVSAPRGLLSRWIVEKPANPLLWLYQERWHQAKKRTGSAY